MHKKTVRKTGAVRAAAAFLAASMLLGSSMDALAGSWSREASGWSYLNDDKSKAANCWVEDAGNWYLIGADGYMKTGWQMVDGKWYFLSLSSAGGVPEGAALTGWQWIDGKCYYFSAAQSAAHPLASMYAGETTPDGYTVNADGQWTEGGNVVSVPGKGIQTSAGAAQGVSIGRISDPSGGGGSASGGSSSGSHRSSSSGAASSGGDAVPDNAQEKDAEDSADDDIEADDSQDAEINDNEDENAKDTDTDDKMAADQAGGTEDQEKPSDSDEIEAAGDAAQPEKVSYKITWKAEDEVIFRLTGTGCIGGTLDLTQFTANDLAIDPISEITLTDRDNAYEIECMTATVATPSQEDDFVWYELSYTDFDTGELIRKEEGKLERDTEIEASFCPDGYEAVDGEQEFVAADDENSFTVQLIKIAADELEQEIEDTKYAAWTVRYVNYDDESEDVLSPQTGTAPVGIFKVTFNKEFNKNGRKWRAVDDSPRTFTIRDNTDMNTFIVRFKQVGGIEQEEAYRTYSLRYIAGDTGSVLGVKVGEGNVGDSVTIRNSWNDYMCPDEASYTIQSEDNEADLTYTRNTEGQPETNEHTGEYDGYEFIALFVDQYGENVFEPVRGKVRDGDTLYIDYPDTVERDGVTYRADKSSPYKSSTGGTTYRQIQISYTRGEASDDKLSSWLQTAQEAKNEFWGPVPYRYAVNLKEYSTDNDIGLYVGVAPKDSEVEVNTVNVPGWITRQGNTAKSFILSDNNMVITREYDKSGGTPSTGGYEREYTILFTDEDGNNLFEPYTGTVSFARMDQTSDFYIYFPRTFVDEEGNRWRTDEESPKDVVLRCNNTSADNIHMIEYYRIYTNPKTEFIVENDADVRSYISDVGSAMYDSELHEFYLIGADYDPSTAVVSETLYGYNLTGYQGAIEDTFELDGVTYKVFHFKLSRTFDEDICEHSWQYADELAGSCYTASQTTVECSLCGETKTVYKGAFGHIDYDYDRVCDVCGQQLSISIGDSITVNWDGGDQYGGAAEISFICIGTDADGNYVLMAEDDITKDTFGSYAEDGKGYYSTSDLKAFLNDGFADGLSVKDNLIEKDGERVTILTQDEYNAYKAAAGSTYLFPDGDFILKSGEEDTVLTTTGTIPVAEADDANVRPVICLPASSSTVGAEGGSWSIGDIQARKIGSEVWLFRCVDENFEDSSATPKQLALFMCDSVIPSNYEMGFGMGSTEDSAGQQETRFFGSTNNNYKYSIINEWLAENTSDTGDLVKVNVGVKTEYSGSTGKGLWDRFSASSLTKHARSSSQTIYARMFIPSVEEAVALGEYLFKFTGSDENNADDIVNNYRRGYFLRTPEYGTTDKVYYVDLVTGCISTTNASAQSEDDVCEIGIRPMYAVEQND